MDIPLLGREYAFPVLQALGKNGQSTFTGLLTELDISRATLSATLHELVHEGYIQKKTLGKYSVYSLKERGSQELSTRTENPVIEQLATYIYETMKSKGQIESNTEKDEVLIAIRKKTLELIEQIVTDATETLKEKEKNRL
jgi:DNA-binding HxlR family transcriptional regulator